MLKLNLLNAVATSLTLLLSHHQNAAMGNCWSTTTIIHSVHGPHTVRSGDLEGNRFEKVENGSYAIYGYIGICSALTSKHVRRDAYALLGKNDAEHIHSSAFENTTRKITAFGFKESITPRNLLVHTVRHLQPKLHNQRIYNICKKLESILLLDAFTH